MDINKNSYNKIYKKWAENRNKSLLNKCVIDFCKKMTQNGKILDIGCGTGQPVTKYLSDNGFTVTGIDISEKLLQMAIDQKLPNAEFILCDFFEFETAEQYDGIIAFDSFFHFPKERQQEIYQKVSGWMKEGAYLLFTHGNKEGELTGEMFGEPFYYSALDTQHVHRLLEQAGLTIESSIEHYTELHTSRDLVILAKK